MLGVISIIASLLRIIVIGAIISNTRKFKLVLSLLLLTCILIMGAFLGLLFTRSIAAVLIMYVLLGFVPAPNTPLAIEFTAETAFPVGEATSSGLLLGVTRLSSAVMVIYTYYSFASLYSESRYLLLTKS